MVSGRTPKAGGGHKRRKVAGGAVRCGGGGGWSDETVVRLSDLERLRRLPVRVAAAIGGVGHNYDYAIYVANRLRAYYTLLPDGVTAVPAGAILHPHAGTQLPPKGCEAGLSKMPLTERVDLLRRLEERLSAEIAVADAADGSFGALEVALQQVRTLPLPLPLGRRLFRPVQARDLPSTHPHPPPRRPARELPWERATAIHLGVGRRRRNGWLARPTPRRSGPSRCPSVWIVGTRAL